MASIPSTAAVVMVAAVLRASARRGRGPSLLRVLRLGLIMTTRAAYIAGVIDSDGHIGWRGGRYRAPDVGVTNTSALLMGWLVDQVGGAFSLERRAGAEGVIARRRDIYRWHVTGERACILLRACRPYLLIKRERADEMLRRYVETLNEMERPKRRLHHIKKERIEMKTRG